MTARSYSTKANGVPNVIDANHINALQTAITELSVLTAKGDLMAGGAGGVETRVPVVNNGWILQADSSQTAGVKWAPVEQFVCLTTDFTLAAASGAQAVLPAANDVLTVTTFTYFFEAFFHVTTGTTSHTTAFGFALGGGAALTSIQYLAEVWSGAAATILTTAPSVLVVTTEASTVLNAASVNPTTYIRLRGVLRVSLGGTITPQINFSANPTGTNLTKANSYVRIWPVGSSSVAAIGAWA